MKHYHICGRIDKDSFENLINFLNNTEGEKKSISINSTGGDVGYAHGIIHALNDVAGETELVVISGVYSAAFIIFYNFKGRKVLFEGSRGMIHRVMVSVTINDNGLVAYKEDISFRDDLKEGEQKALKWVESFMTPQEFKKYKKGSDVYFTTSRMREIFPDAIFVSNND